jgi:hypothetical protein
MGNIQTVTFAVSEIVGKRIGIFFSKTRDDTRTELASNDYGLRCNIDDGGVQESSHSSLLQSAKEVVLSILSII